MWRKNGKRVRCHHRYKGLDALYVPRFSRKQEKLITEYQCQIKGCNHWQVVSINSIRNNQTREERQVQPLTALTVK